MNKTFLIGDPNISPLIDLFTCAGSFLHPLELLLWLIIIFLTASALDVITKRRMRIWEVIDDSNLPINLKYARVQAGTEIYHEGIDRVGTITSRGIFVYDSFRPNGSSLFGSYGGGGSYRKVSCMVGTTLTDGYLFSGQSSSFRGNRFVFPVNNLWLASKKAQHTMLTGDELLVPFNANTVRSNLPLNKTNEIVRSL